jgi:hypothetical protein
MTDSASGIAVEGDLAALVNGAFENGVPILVAYVDANNQAHLSFRGSTHVHAPDQLAIWVRDPAGGLPNAIENNPQLTLMYRNAPTRSTIFFYGRGHVENDDATRARVYDESPEGERGRDPEKKGVPLIVDLDVVQGGSPDARVDMRRA